MTVRIACMGEKRDPRRPEWIRVRAYSTRSKHFVVTPVVERVGRRKYRYCQVPGEYTLTHKKTGFLLLKNIHSVRQGQLLAVIADRLPVKWDSLTVTNSKRRFSKLDIRWRPWVYAFNTLEVAA